MLASSTPLDTCPPSGVADCRYESTALALSGSIISFATKNIFAVYEPFCCTCASTRTKPNPLSLISFTEIGVDEEEFFSSLSPILTVVLSSVPSTLLLRFDSITPSTTKLSGTHPSSSLELKFSDTCTPWTSPVVLSEMLIVGVVEDPESFRRFSTFVRYSLILVNESLKVARALSPSVCIPS